MRLAIFGATGGTGRALVRAALTRGHDVTAVVRDPSRLDEAHERLVVRRGDVLDPASLATVLADADAVASALGAAGGRAATTVYSVGVANVLDAMRTADVRRLVALSAAPVVPRSEATLVERLLLFPILNRFFGGLYADMRRMEDVLATSDVDWTVLRPPQLTDKAATGRYRTAVGRNVPGGRSITRGDLAAAMLDVLESGSSVRTALGVAN